MPARRAPMPELMLGVPVAQVNKLEVDPNLMAPTCRSSSASTASADIPARYGSNSDVS